MKMKDGTPESRARRIIDEREYEAAKQLLAAQVRSLKPFLVEGRLHALLRVLSEYEERAAHSDAVPSRIEGSADVGPKACPQRRWSDMTSLHIEQTA